MGDNVGKNYIDNGIIKECTGSDPAAILDAHEGIKIYEVIRIIDGIPLFFEDHYIRMCKSFQSLGHACRIGAEEFREQIHRIVAVNENENCNIKFIIFSANGEQRVLGYISKSYYPSLEEIRNGVPVGLLPLERENPNIKLVDHDYKKKINKIKAEKGFYEVFLVDREGNVTEGGTSNIFFIKGNKILTASEEKVLKGITRMHVIEVCKDMGYEVVETSIAASRLHEAEGVFLSGTSPKVLPVSSIDDIKYSSAKHPVIAAIREAFDDMINEYLMKNR